MPPRKSNDSTPTQAVTKPRAKRSVKCEEAELTPTQQKRKERHDMLAAAKKRQARNMERPNDHEDNGFLSKTILFTRKLPAYPSYDEIPNKRRRVDLEPKKKKLARRAPWDKDSKFKKPSSPPNPPVRTSPRDPVTPMGRFSMLPVEICDEILRYILLWPHDIIVFDEWSRVFPRTRPRLNLSILYTCRVLRKQGLQILYGENIFAHDLRDPPASHGHTAPVLDKVFGNSVVPINEFGHLIRHIKIKMHRSRIRFNGHRRKFEYSILKFLPGGGLAHTADLHTVTLEVPAETNGDLQLHSDTVKEEDVPICKYFEKDSKLFDALFKIQIQWVHVLAWDTHGKCWQTAVDMRYFAKDKQMKIEHMATDKDPKHNKVESFNNQSVLRGSAAATSYRTKDVEAMEKLWDERVEIAKAGLCNLASRIKILATDPDRAIIKLKQWTPVKTPASGSEIFLPSNFRDPSLSRSTRSKRGQISPGSNLLDVKKMPTGSETNPKAKAGTAIRTNINPLNIPNTKDTEKEARLLEAQQDIQMNEAEIGKGGMLTEQWLENLPHHNMEDIQGTTEGDKHEMDVSDFEQCE
ncbi:hypothetical protein FHL15_002981 [Xylaria flabelliformis]|uniref:F-box domain-containing protein n=1 Tax=Xylaria flabelliformis TaxID=2512241 RepID=A0A553I7T3_9PEZI|nr:hypothetical protein FHL15_002981 [Xylaria flabelliformis]